MHGEEGVADIQTLYAMLAALPFGLAIPEAVLQVRTFHTTCVIIPPVIDPIHS